MILNENTPIEKEEITNTDIESQNTKTDIVVLIKEIFNQNKKIFIITSFLIIVFILLVFLFSTLNKDNINDPQSPTVLEGLLNNSVDKNTQTTEETDEDSSEENSNKETQTPSPDISTPTPTGTAIPTSTPTPSVSNPPTINISYPQEMQTISLRDGEKLCLVENPTGGNTDGLQRKEILSGSQWTSYVDTYRLCYFPHEGLNTIQIQYRNSNGDESQVYTRKFNFDKNDLIDISISGLVYRDVNCNGVKDSGENNIDTSATINVFKHPEFYIFRTLSTDSSGNYSFTRQIYENETVMLQPLPVSPTGYKANPHYTIPTVSLNSSNTSASINIPQVPNENIEACQ